MKAIFGPVLIYLVIKIVLLAIASIVGFLLHWLVPSIDAGMALLIGVLLTGMAFHFFGRLTSWLDDYRLTTALLDPEEFSTPPMPVVSPPAPRRGRKRR